MRARIRHPAWSVVGVTALVAVLLAACAQILGIRPPSERAFPHRAHVIEGVNCLQCHAGVDRAGERGALHLPTKSTCTGCHETPHDTRECSSCHGRPETRGRAVAAREHLRFAHAQHAQGTRTDCVRCHLGAGNGHDTLRPPMAACFGCHEHRGEWRVRQCDGCHVALEDEGAPPESHLVHSEDFLREHGVRAASARDMCATCHSETDCAECHGTTVPGLPARLGFGRQLGIGSSFHAAGFASRHSDEARIDPTTCTSCHGQRECIDCHVARRVTTTDARGGSPHPPGWLGLPGSGNEHGRAARLDPVGCASCHGGAGETLCVGCHRVGGGGGSPHPPGFSSTLDARTNLPCRMCHGDAP